MKRYLMAFALLVVSGVLLSSIARPHRAAADAHGLLANVSAVVRSLAPAAYDPSTPPGTYNVTLSRAQVSPTDNHRIIVVMDAAGDLRGALTLGLDRNGEDGAVTGGEWALVVAYTEETQHEPEGDGGEDHSETLVQKGTLKGSIAGGQITLNPDGTIASVDSLQLVLDGGSLTYQGVTHGSGSALGANLHDPSASSGSLNLNF